MPNRIIKESIRTSKKINALTDFQFRLWAYLITYVDDYGRGSADPEILKGFVFPRRKRVTESDIDKALLELAGMGCIHLYTVDGESYFCFPNWSDHQRIQTKKSKYPAPVHGGSPWLTVGYGEPPPESNPNPNPNPNPKEKGASAPRSKFVKPTVDEVREYCNERKNAVNPETFCDFYESKGWKIGKDPMRDWKAAVRTWERREPQSETKAAYDLDEYESQALKELEGYK